MDTLTAHPQPKDKNFMKRCLKSKHSVKSMVSLQAEITIVIISASTDSDIG